MLRCIQACNLCADTEVDLLTVVKCVRCGLVWLTVRGRVVVEGGATKKRILLIQGAVKLSCDHVVLCLADQS